VLQQLQSSFCAWNLHLDEFAHCLAPLKFSWSQCRFRGSDRTTAPFIPELRESFCSVHRFAI
jgi:hypothetical protein